MYIKSYMCCTVYKLIHALPYVNLIKTNWRNEYKWLMDIGADTMDAELTGAGITGAGDIDDYHLQSCWDVLQRPGLVLGEHGFSCHSEVHLGILQRCEPFLV